MNAPKDPYRYFRVEAKEILDGLTRAALDLEKGSPRPGLPGEVMRLAHTLKGAARVVKQPGIAEIAHAIEDLFAAGAPGGEAPAGRERIDEFLRLLDRIGAAVAALEPAARAAPEGPPGPAVAPAETPAAESRFEMVRVEVGELDSILQEVSHAVVKMRELRQTAGALERSRRIASSLIEQTGPRRSSRDVAAAPGVPSRIRSMAESLLEAIQRAHRDLTVGLEHAESNLRELQSKATRVRLIPSGSIFDALERAARDAARTTGREILFETSGGDIRVDGHVLGLLRDALLHVVRNAVDHGIETPSERIAAGKEPAGRIRLRVERRGSRLAFICHDDGRGIDPDAVRSAAVRGGILSQPEASSLDREKILRLVLRGGLSTSPSVTSVSGRGVGLDVVRETAVRLRGEVTVESEPGRGTSLTLEVPISLSSMDALVVEVGENVAAIPLHAVERTLRVSESDIARGADADTILHEGRAIPLRHLGSLLPGRRGEETAARPGFAVLVRSGGEVAALAVDRLVGVSEVVVQRVPEIAGGTPQVAGACLDEVGVPRMVLDPDALVPAAGRARGRPARPEPRAAAPVLVVDDSLTTRMLEQSILESAGYQVDLATSGEEALDMARKRDYSLFVVDIEMPGMDGFEFISRARSDAGLSEVPSILLTSRSSPEDRRRGAEVGARAFIVKSEFDQGYLLKTIRELTA